MTNGNDVNMDGAKLYRKKVLTPMVRMDGPFFVETPEGRVECADGWLAVDSKGGRYPVEKSVHDDMYEEAQPPARGE
jgi:hypothetical protein